MFAFFDLPAELRIKIYEYATTLDTPIQVVTAQNLDPTPKSQSRRARTFFKFDACPLLLVNKETRIQSLPMYLASNTFHLDDLPIWDWPRDLPPMFVKYCHSLQVGGCFVWYWDKEENHHMQVFDVLGHNAAPSTVRLDLIGPPEAQSLRLQLEYHPDVRDFLPSRYGCSVVVGQHRWVASAALESYIAERKGKLWTFSDLISLANYFQRETCFDAEDDDEDSLVTERIFQLM